MADETITATEGRDRLSLAGQTAIITGVGPGIGEHVATAYAQAGARVVLFARSADRVQAVAESLERSGCEALAVQGDVAVDDDLRRLVESARDRFGSVDILFNNAAANNGVGVERTWLDISDEDWQACVDVNLLAPFRLAKALVPAMASKGRGVIINVISTAGFTVVPRIGAFAYGATKAGLMMLTRYLARECGPTVRVNALCPGTIDANGQMREIWKPLMADIPLGRVGCADEVVGAALFLASPASSYTTGQCIFVDGGRV
jgi:NAD(P)-dependent dehydrogenase (short-subunit alcohol dehydrogenase family)